MAAHKGHEKAGGRAKGTPNKVTAEVTAEVKAFAKEFGREAIESLAHLMRHAESDATKVAAIKELLDRGWGKATTPIKHSGDAGRPVRVVFETVYERKPD